MFRYSVIPLIVIVWNFFSIINSQHLPLCESLNDIQGNEKNHSDVKSRRVRALCDAIYSSRTRSEQNELDSIPDFDLEKINSEIDADEILHRFRRGRGGRGGGGGGRSGGGGRFGGGRFSSSFSRSSSGGSRFFGSRSSSSSSGSRIFSRSSSSSSSSSGSGFRFFSRSSSSGGTSSGHRVREAIRSMVRKPSTSGGGAAVSSNTGSQSRVRQAVRTMFRHSPSPKPSGSPSVSGGIAGGSGAKPGLSDKIRQITHGSGGSGFSATGSGGNVWVRAGKTFLPQAARFGKRYYQRRKYNKGLYAGAGYYAGSHMGHHNHYYGYHHRDNYYGYPPVVETPPDKVDGKTPTVFYCLQEDLNATLVNKTLDDEGFGMCNISGKLVKCPLEIECQTSEADTCCEDENGTPYCCGGPIPEEYASPYGGYGDDLFDAAESLNKILNMMTAMSVVLATICLTMWQHRRGQ